MSENLQIVQFQHNLLKVQNTFSLIMLSYLLQLGCQLYLIILVSS